VRSRDGCGRLARINDEMTKGGFLIRSGVRSRDGCGRLARINDEMTKSGFFDKLWGEK